MVPLIISFFKDFFVKSSGLICSLSTFLLHVDRICRLAGIHQNFHIYVTPGIIASYIYKVSFSHVALFWKFGKVVESHPRWNYFMENLQKKGIYKACFPGNFPSFSEQMFFKESLYDCSVILSRNSKIWHTFILIFVILLVIHHDSFFPLELYWWKPCHMIIVQLLTFCWRTRQIYI